jgi:hypothetical protein
MAVMHCPHCGAENFTMEGWEDLDHCSSCGKPLGELDPDVIDDRPSATRPGEARERRNGAPDGKGAKRPHPA